MMGVLAPNSHLVAPAQLPDGTTVWSEAGGDVGVVVQMLREYDTRLNLCRSNVRDCWEVWRQCEDGEARRVASRPGTHVPNGPSLVAFLAAHDTQRGYDPVADTFAYNDRVDADRAAVAGERFEDKADRLAFALGRDLDEPAQSGRLYPLGGPGK